MSGHYREYSESGIYHVMTRGVGEQPLIFESDDDVRAFLKILRWALEHYSGELYAYCLMLDHLHLLVKSGEDRPSKFMQKLQELYTRHFNNQHKREGSLFQPRFRSKAVDDDKYFLSVLRYILTNPEEAGVAPHDQYPWSSYREYVTPDTVVPALRVTHTDFAQSFFKDVDAFAAFIADWRSHEQSGGRKSYLRYRQAIRVSDADAVQIIKDVLEVTSPTEVATFAKTVREEALRTLYRHGMPAKQMSRLTGISIATVYRAQR
ncbi:MAG: transposase [Actinomycetaceae bacterium]|nr:transposase [Actinomycetaceae bacterium]MDY5855254.1 transposase [Arcanobacterium sp.]